MKTQATQATARAGTLKQRDVLSTLRISRSEHRQRHSAWRRFFKTVLWLAVVSGVVCGAVWLANRLGWLSVADLLAPRPEVRVAQVQVETGRSAEALVVATGYLESRRQAKIGAKAPGRIQRINVEEGTKVKQGQELAVLEHADLDAALAAAQATLQRAQAELVEHEKQIALDLIDRDRVAKLRTQGIISEEDYDHAQYKYDISLARRGTLQAAVALNEARVQEAQQMKENMFVRAPFDGTVISKEAEVGESILPGGMGEASGRGSVVMIADLDHLEVDADVKEDYISRVRIGQAAEVAVDAVPDRRYIGRVRKIIPMGDRARATIKVKVEIIDADERLFPEMSSTVYFLPEHKGESADHVDPDRRKVFVPADAVQSLADGQYVWRVDPDERAHRLSVRTGSTLDGRVEIESGLTGGERVVVGPVAELRDGEPVRVTE